jgi:hypothetical protein
MTGTSTDHLVSLTVLITALTLSLGFYSQVINGAVTYHRNQQVAIKVADLVHGMILNPGYPSSWGELDITPSSFGLQDPEARGYSLSPFAMMRITDPDNLISFEGSTFLNISMGQGAYFFIPVSDHLNYTTASELLGVNGSYGFRVTVEPTLRISFEEVSENPLQLRVIVSGPGGSVEGAFVNATCFATEKTQGSTPSFTVHVSTAETDLDGSALLSFPTVDAVDGGYSVLAQAQLSGLIGIGFYSSTTKLESLLVPIITDYDEGEVGLYHLFDVMNKTGDFGPADDLKYNMTYYFQTVSGWRNVQLSENATGDVQLGHSGEVTVQIPVDQPGILMIAWSGVVKGEGRIYRTVVMPWGMGALGMYDLSLSFGGDPSGKSWVATEMRQVTVNEIPYQITLAVWSEEGYQV